MSGSLGKISVHKGVSKDTKEAQFEQLYNAYFDKLYTYAKVICGSQELAKDVVSEFFFNLWKNQQNLQAIKNPDAYFFITIKNQALKMLSNKFNKTDQLESKLLKLVDLVNPEEVLLEKELRSLLDKVIETLPGQCRLIFQMTQQGHTPSKIASQLDISIETVKTQLKRARKKLRKQLIHHYGDSKLLRLLG